MTKISKYLLKIMICIILGLLCLICIKKVPNFKVGFYNHVFKKNFSFATINDSYQKIFGSPLPFKNWFKLNTEPVFNEEFKYKEINLYNDGVKVTVDEAYLIPSLDSGLVIFSGEKEEYGNVVIVQQINGIDVWYGNIASINVKLYDYIEKGSLIGEANENYMYLVFKKDDVVLDYNDYI